MLDVGDGHRLAWSIAGNPDGKPAVVLHGGPGSGASPRFRRWFDPERYRVVLFDQRSCGKSTPHAAEPVIDLSTNTTAHLVDDIERLRTHLGIDRWLVWGGRGDRRSASPTPRRIPDRVTEMILVSVVTTTAARSSGSPARWAGSSRSEWERVPRRRARRAIATATSRPRTPDCSQDADAEVRERAAVGWCKWEDTHVATFPGYAHDDRYDDPRFRLCFARLVTHYWANAAFLEDGQLLRDATRLAGIPGVLITGQLDISGPPDVAWQLAQRWPDAELVLVDDAGHGAGHRTTEDEIVAATTRFARCSRLTVRRPGPRRPSRYRPPPATAHRARSRRALAVRSLAAITPSTMSASTAGHGRPRRRTATTVPRGWRRSDRSTEPSRGGLRKLGRLEAQPSRCVGQRARAAAVKRSVAPGSITTIVHGGWDIPGLAVWARERRPDARSVDGAPRQGAAG